MTQQADNQSRRPRILLVEDDSAMVALVGVGLRYEGFDVLTAATAPEGLQSALSERPDLVIVDWMLPGFDGVELCRRLRRTTGAPIIMLTARGSVENRVMGLNAGADDYLVKPFDLNELVARVRARLRAWPERQEVVSFRDLELHLGLREARRMERRIRLTATEFNLLALFMRHPRHVLSKETILEAVWGYDFEGDANVVEQYVHSLRRKLGEPQLIHTLRLAGYALREAP